VGKYEAIFFDFDGVLVDSEPVHFSCWQEILEPFGIAIDWATYCKHCIGITDRAMLSFLCSRRDPPLSIDELYKEYPRKKEMFRDRMLASKPVSEEVCCLVDRLRSNHKLAVVTSSGRREVEPILDASGLLPWLDACVYGEEVQRHKPAPDPYLMALDRLGVERALVVEDSEAGQASGRAAGLDVLPISLQRDMCAQVLERLGLDS
jgi:HAD superfamily hydrolase (TIGR01509 family)